MESYKRMQKRKRKNDSRKCKQGNENLVLGKVKAIKRNFQEEKPKSKNIRDEGGNIIQNKNEQANRWKEYLEKLYGEETTMNPIEEENLWTKSN